MLHPLFPLLSLVLSTSYGLSCMCALLIAIPVFDYPCYVICSSQRWYSLAGFLIHDYDSKRRSLHSPLGTSYFPSQWCRVHRVPDSSFMTLSVSTWFSNALQPILMRPFISGSSGLFTCTIWLKYTLSFTFLLLLLGRPLTHFVFRCWTWLSFLYSST